METTPYDGRTPVASLRFCLTRPGSTQKLKNIFPREQIDIGRSDIKKLLGTEVLTVSTHHLRLRCIVYEDGDERAVAPLIYFRVLSFNSVELKRTGAGHNTGVEVSRGHGDILLSEGDVLRLTPEVYLQFHYNTSVPLHDALDSLQRAEAKQFADQFLLSGRRLGGGSQGNVFIAVKQRTKRQFACKALPLKTAYHYAYQGGDRRLRLTTAQREAKLMEERRSLAKEYTILQDVDHPNIVSLEKVICTSYNVYIFQELITGGDLSSYMAQSGPLAEPQAASIVLQLLKAVEYLHSNGYAHRDIKPENILMTSWREGTRVLLTDFGQAKAIDGPDAARKSARALRMQTLVGTPGYAAPEIFEHLRQSLQEEGYSKAVDLWSIGCVTAALLTSETLFPQRSNGEPDSFNDSSESTSCDHFDVNIIDNQPSWIHVSGKAKSFVKGCLARDEGKRLTAKGALLEGWFTNKHYAADLAAAYERAIADWQPRSAKGRRLEIVDTTNLIQASQESASLGTEGFELKSKHFQEAHIPVSLPPFATKGTAHALPFKPQPPSQPAMSREARYTHKTMAPSALYTMDDFTLAGPGDPEDSTPFAGYTAYSGTGPLSIHNYGPPQTPFSFRPQQLIQPPDSITQPQSMLDGPNWTSLQLPMNVASYSYHGDRVVDSQETQSQLPSERNDRPRKKVCR